MALTVLFTLTKQRPVDAGTAFNQKLHTILVQLETFAPADTGKLTPLTTDLVDASYDDVGDTPTNQIAATQAKLLPKLTEALLRRDLEYILEVHAKHDQMITDLTTALGVL